jgi:FtsX-like permease family
MLRHDLRRRTLALLGLALILVLGGGATLGALVLAHRTDRAYPDYVDDAEVSDLVVNPSLSTRAMDRVLRSLPEVVEAHWSSLLFAGVVPPALAGKPLTVAELNDTDPWVQALGSPDGRFTEVDRPAVTEGRVPSGNHEVFVALGIRRRMEQQLGRPINVGSTIPVAFFSPAKADPELGASPEDIVEPIAVEQLRVSGFGRLPDDVLPEGLFPNERFIVSGDVARRYTCLNDVHADQSPEEALAANFPERCARSYDYYALLLRHGTAGAASVRSGFARAAERLTADIPPTLQAGYFYIPQNRADLDAAVRRTTRPTVVTLLAFSVIAALTTIIVFALTFTRLLGRDAPIRASLRAIGASRGTRARLALGAPLLAVAAGVVGAVVGAVVISAVGPIGNVSSVVPDPGVSAPAAVLIPATSGFVLVLLLVVAGLAWSTAGGSGIDGTRRAPSGVLREITSLRRTGRPALTEGVRASLSFRGGSGGIAAAGCAIALLVVIGAAIFDANLVALSDQPTRYGWPWDVAVIAGAGYGNTNLAAAREVLDAKTAVRDYGFYALDASVRIDGRPVASIIGFRGSPAPALPIVSGRMATAPNEAVLGAASAAELDLSVGDHARVAGDLVSFAGANRVEIVGIAVLPTIGAFGSAHAGLGLGAYIRTGARPTEDAVSLTAIRLQPGTDARAFTAALPFRKVGWDKSGALPVTHAAAIRPPEIATVDSLRAAPALLGVALGIALLIGLTLVSALSVHDRRRELAILRALGFGDRSLRATVAWQTLTTVGVGLLVGVPLGIVVGRVVWRAFATELGLVPSADVPIAVVAAIAIGIAALAMLAAAVPARAATRVRADALHAE